MEINKQTSTEVYYIYNSLLLLSVSQFYGLFVCCICVVFYSIFFVFLFLQWFFSSIFPSISMSLSNFFFLSCSVFDLLGSPQF